MTFRDLANLAKEAELKGILDNDIAYFTYDEDSNMNWITAYLNDDAKPDIMCEFSWNGKSFEYREFDSTI